MTCRTAGDTHTKRENTTCTDEEDLFMFADLVRWGISKTPDNDHYLCKLSTGDSLMPIKV